MGLIFAEKALYGSDAVITNPAKSGRASGSASRGMQTASCDFIFGAVRSSAVQDRSGYKRALSGLLTVQSDKRTRSSSTFAISSWRRGFLASDVSAKSRIRYRASAAASAHVVDGAARAYLSNSSLRRRRAAWSP